MKHARHVLPCALAVLLALALAPWCAAQEWTRFRGPNGSGLSQATTVPAQWSDSDYNWKIELPGIGHSSPVIWGHKLFLTSADEQNAERIVLCIDTESGRTLWERRFASQAHHKHLRNSFASSTPAVDELHVYLCWTTPDEYTLLALDHDGRDAWKLDLGPFESQHSGGTSPIVYEDLVILNNDQDGPSFLVAVDRRSGEIRWKAPRDSAVVAYSTPCVLSREGRDELIFNSQAHGISSIDPLTGKTNWEMKVFDKRSVSSPIVAGGLVFGTCGSGGGGIYVAAVRPGPEPELAYKITEGGTYVPSVVAKDDLLFIVGDKGIASCSRLATGETVWRERLGGNFSGSPVIVNDKLYAIAEDGTVVVLSASENFAILGQMPLGEDSRSTPAVAGGRMYLRTYSHLFSIGGTKR